MVEVEIEMNLAAVASAAFNVIDVPFGITKPSAVGCLDDMMRFESAESGRHQNLEPKALMRS